MPDNFGTSQAFRSDHVQKGSF